MMINHRFLRRPEVEARTGLSRGTIYTKMNERTFPRPMRIGKRAVAWKEEDIDRWIAQQTVANPDEVFNPGRTA